MINLNRKTWITSDTHFGHANIIKHTGRPFATANEMDRELINNWNNIVNPDDDVIHLGDFCWDEPTNYLRNLTFNRLYLMRGNHDKSRVWNKIGNHYSSDRVTLLTPYEEFEVDKRFVCCHYPILEWNWHFHGSAHFFGHVHTAKNKKFVGAPGSYDVGVDNNNYTPILLEEAMEKCNRERLFLGCQIETSSFERPRN